MNFGFNEIVCCHSDFRMPPVSSNDGQKCQLQQLKEKHNNNKWILRQRNKKRFFNKFVELTIAECRSPFLNWRSQNAQKVSIVPVYVSVWKNYYKISSTRYGVCVCVVPNKYDEEMLVKLCQLTHLLNMTKCNVLCEMTAKWRQLLDLSPVFAPCHWCSCLFLISGFDTIHS